MRAAEDPAVRLALEHGLLTPPQLEAARSRFNAGAAAPGPRPRLADFLVAEGVVDGRRLARVLGERLHLPVVEAGSLAVPPEALGLAPRELLEQVHALPYARAGGTLRVAVSDPFDFDAIDRLARATGLALELAVAPADEIDRALGAWPGGPPSRAAAEGAAGRDGGAEAEDDGAPVLQLISSVLREAAGRRASDVHFEPMEKRFRVRFRVDGVLQEAADPPARLQRAVISRLKLMSGMSIAEKRRPQDGRAHYAWDGRTVDLRVSSVPTVHGESVVLRLLEPERVRLGLDDLGLGPADGQTLGAMLALTEGLVLVTGPTGSGKTTTLYACLNHLNRADRKIVTVEDPVEYQLPGVNQVPVRAEIGLTFAAALRAMLRQAPNVIMVGEIRDRETAEIAIHAALTGHLVFSTLHTNDAPGAVTRLIDLGVKPFLVASALRAVLAQRLVRRVCPQCRGGSGPDGSGSAPGEPGAPRGRGCPACARTGYRGRLGIFEFLVVDEELQRMIHEGRRTAELRAHARTQGMGSLREDGARKADAGLTTREEVLAATVDDANGM